MNYSLLLCSSIMGWTSNLSFELSTILNRILLRSIHLSCVRWPCDQLQIFVSNWAQQWIESYWYELFNCRVFLDHRINFKSLLRIEHNIWIVRLFELFICRVRRSCDDQLQIFASNWAQYLNSTFVWIIHLSCSSIMWWISNLCFELTTIIE
jgi:hypothetical protein